MIDAAQKPLLFVDVDGVISVYGFNPQKAAAGTIGKLHNVDGILHHIGPGMAERLGALGEVFELVWATGWGHRANEHLVLILGMPGELEVVEFEVAPSTDSSGHWKLRALDRRAGSERPAAWIDDGHNDSCVEWAESRSAQTLLVTTDPFVGMTDDHVQTLTVWARGLAG